MAECQFQTPELPTPVELIRMGVDVSPEREARIRAAAAGTVYVHHPEADDCFNVMGMGKSNAEAYSAMLDDLYDHVSGDFATDAEASTFYAEIVRRKEESKA
jgi:hypothetical protein